MEPSPAALAEVMIERARRDLEARARTVAEGLSRDGEYEVRRALEDATRCQVDLLRLEELPASFRESVLRDGAPLP